jgi:hypothetical protein
MLNSRVSRKIQKLTAKFEEFTNAEIMAGAPTLKLLLIQIQ